MSYVVLAASPYAGPGENEYSAVLWDTSNTPTYVAPDIGVTPRALLNLSPDNSMVYALSSDGRLGAFYVDGGAQVPGSFTADAVPNPTIRLHYNDAFWGLPEMHPDGDSVLLRSSTALSGAAVTLNVSTMSGYTTIATVEPVYRVGHTAYSPDGTRVAVCAHTRFGVAAPTAMVRVYDWETGDEVSLGTWWLSAGHAAMPMDVWSVCWSPDSSMLAITYTTDASSTNYVIVLDGATGAILVPPRTFPNRSFEYSAFIHGWTTEGRVVISVTYGVAVPGEPDSASLRVYTYSVGALTAAGNIDTLDSDGDPSDVEPNFVKHIPGTEYVVVARYGIAALDVRDTQTGSLIAQLTDSEGVVTEVNTINPNDILLRVAPVASPPAPVFWTNRILCRETP